jgi:SAM-dependent methyltransferase
MTTQTTSRTSTTEIDEADKALKAKHRAVWASGDYVAVARQVVPSLGPRLVEAAGVSAGARVLDVAAGAGNAAIPAALAGAIVTASDLTPELFDAGRHDASAAGVTIDWVEADAEHLPFDDAAFESVLSCVGVMFAPHHQQAADELLRVCRPGGTIALISWTPEGFIGQLLATLKPFAPAPPAGSQPAPLWGNETHVRELLGRAARIDTVRENLSVRMFGAEGSFREYFRTNYGPVGSVYRSLGDDTGRRAELDAAIDDLAERFTDVYGLMQWEYLLVTATR